MLNDLPAKQHGLQTEPGSASFWSRPSGSRSVMALRIFILRQQSARDLFKSELFPAETP